ncbi:MAG: formate dehydrogenase accessory sulfurtransferase FdhD, partial [Candidatus Nezhaarchaeota archaeon]|nr:formate dehydrogenase accessory sulfurtransferase FdhD [Candidatus Nezhaarchaeota archaeon]
MISRVRVLKFRLEGGFEELTDDVAVEEETRLYVDGRLYAVFYHSPAQVKEMVIGYLLTEGVVSGVDDVLE